MESSVGMYSAAHSFDFAKAIYSINSSDSNTVHLDQAKVLIAHAQVYADSIVLQTQIFARTIESKAEGGSGLCEINDQSNRLLQT